MRILKIQTDMRKCLIVVLLLAIAGFSATAAGRAQWTTEEAQEWWAKTEWPLGCNITLAAGDALPGSFGADLEKCRQLGSNTVRLILECPAADAAKVRKLLSQALAALQAPGIKAAVALYPGKGLSETEFNAFVKTASALVSAFSKEAASSTGTCFPLPWRRFQHSGRFPLLFRHCSPPYGRPALHSLFAVR